MLLNSILTQKKPQTSHKLVTMSKDDNKQLYQQGKSNRRKNQLVRHRDRNVVNPYRDDLKQPDSWLSELKRGLWMAFRNARDAFEGASLVSRMVLLLCVAFVGYFLAGYLLGGLNEGLSWVLIGPLGIILRDLFGVNLQTLMGL